MKTIVPRNRAAPRVVVIGGGTGLSTMLRGLKLHTDNLTAIVTVSDDGGGSGVLRSELNMPPPGDVRNCIQALANTEPTMEALLGYRFKSGTLAGQSLGNLFLAALNDMCPSFDEAIMKLSDVLAVTGRVLPVTNCNVILAAEFDDGKEVPGESKISEYKKSGGGSIRRVKLIPEDPPALKASIEALENAEMIVLGPGSLYTSIIPNLLIKGISETIAASDAVRVYVLNVMTQEGETEGYTASDHIRALTEHAGSKLFDYCIADNSPFPEKIKRKYNSKGTDRTVTDGEKIAELGIELINAPVADYSKGLARHNSITLAKTLMQLFINKSPTRIYG